MKSTVDPPPSRFPDLWVATLALTAVVIGCWNLAMPGLQYDETLFCNAALGGPTDAFVCQRVYGVPILLMPYLGALKAWIYAPIFATLPVIAPGGVCEFVLYADAEKKQELATLTVARPAN